jgi:hypothetical protein
VLATTAIPADEQGIRWQMLGNTATRGVETLRTGHTPPMTDHIVVSRAGIRALIRLTRQQHEHHRAIWDFTRDLDLYEGRWFDKGFLSLFRGDYDSATDDVFSGMSEASTGTHQLVDRMEQARDDIEKADLTVDVTMNKLTEVQEAVQVPEFVKRYGGVMNLGGTETPGKHRAPKHEGSAANAIDAVSSLLSMAHHTDQMVDGVTTDDELDDFVEEHRDDVEDMEDTDD